MIPSKMKWNVKFFSHKVEQDILALPHGISVKLGHILELMEDYGPNLNGRFTKAIGDGLFEIRVKAKEGISRSFFCISTDRHIIILHSFIKKTQKIPQKELDIAKKRLKEVLL